MRALRAFLRRLAGLFGRDRRERELAEEIESHLQMHVDDNVRAGMTPEEARRDALLRLGGVESTKEAWRDRSTFPVVDHLVRDARYALRQLGQRAGFTATAVLTLALGTGAAVAIFAFVDAALVKPLPYRDPARLVGVFEAVEAFPQDNLSYPDYLDWKRMSSTLASLSAYGGSGFRLSTGSGVQPVTGARVSDDFFRTLGVRPVLGRDFRDGEDLPGAPRTVLLSYGAWQARFGGSPDVLGRTLTLSGDPTVVIGVLPRDFHFAPAEPAEFWTTLHPESECDLRRSCHSLYGVGRLKDGVSVASAEAEMKSIARRLEAQYPDSNRGQGAAVLPLAEVVVGNIRPTLLTLLGGAAVLLVIASVNVMGLVLVRSEGRRREVAVRSAMGASSVRLVAQFVTEGLVLSLAGCALGLVAAQWAMRLLIGLIPANLLGAMPFLQDLGLNPRVLAFAAVVAVAAAALFSVTPALRLASPAIREALAEGSRGSAGTIWRRLGARLVVLELAMAMVLLVGAGLLGKSLYRLLQVDLGLRPDGLVTMQIAAPASVYGKDAAAIALVRDLDRRLRALPGVQSVGFVANGLPLGSNGNTTWFRVLGRPWHGEHDETPERDVSPAYFETLGAPLLAGRAFTESDDLTKPRVAIVNRALARRYFPGEDPLGKQLSFLSDPPVPMEIVGVVDDVREGPLDAAVPPALYLPLYQSTGNYLGVVVRAAQADAGLLRAMSATVRGIDPEIAVVATQTMRERVDLSPSAYLHRSSAWLVGGFAVLALLLGVIGLYGVIAYSVGQRTREIGVRIALGAQRRSVYELVLGEAGGLIALGTAAGLVLSVAAASAMQGLLFGVRSWDLPTLVVVAIVLGGSALVASYLPARRAASIDPVEALRTE
ncbi:MAG: ABC transporter permease [Vicinamibacteria bacterium]